MIPAPQTLKNGRFDNVFIGQALALKLNSRLDADLDAPQVGLPLAFALSQNVPNPFGGGTVLPYALPERARVRMVVYNLMGQEVAKILDGEVEGGHRTQKWNGTDKGGRPLPSGIYFVRMNAKGLERGALFTATRRLVIFR